MKKNRSYLIILIILLIIAILLIIKTTTSTLHKELRNFAIEDTASVSKIFLTDKKNRRVLLVRQPDGRWRLNNKYVAAISPINVLLSTMYNISVRSPVPLAMRNNVIKRMSYLGVKVEIYQNVYRINLFDKIHWFKHEKLTKVFYVGDDTKDNLGTFMLLDGSDEPFITNIESFRGFLSTRFRADEDVWRDYTIFHYRLADIQSVKMEFPQFPDSSFIINKVGKFKYSFSHLPTSLNPQPSPIPYDTIKLLGYLSYFLDIRFEALLNTMDKHEKDSILSSTPWHIITVTDTKGIASQVKTFHMKNANGPFFDVAAKKTVIYDRDRLYALINGGNDFSLIQFFVFGKILKSAQNFKKS